MCLLLLFSWLLMRFSFLVCLFCTSFVMVQSLLMLCSFLSHCKWSQKAFRAYTLLDRVNFLQLKHLKAEMLEHFLCAIILKFLPKLFRKLKKKKNEKRISDFKRACLKRNVVIKLTTITFMIDWLCWLILLLNALVRLSLDHH